MQTSNVMKLMMYIGNDLIEAVPLQQENLRLPGYLGKFKRSLKMKYSELISQSPQPPEFLVIEPTPPTQQGQKNK
ncbi:MAG: hypothetical protein E6H06_06570 [Bacteroidetes bacterium]|nr:MAG: hypothetical protein E6H06_06570 [Bacteroidota bacterium]